MFVTRQHVLPALTATEQSALFTFSKLVPDQRLLGVTVSELLAELSDHISVSWDGQIDPDELDLCWNDTSDDTFVLNNTSNLCYLLSIHRLHWCRHQDGGPLLPPRPFTDFSQSCVSRVTGHFLFLLATCHKLTPRENQFVPVGCFSFVFFGAFNSFLLSLSLPLCHFSFQYD